MKKKEFERLSMKDDYKNFSELAEYAFWRIQKSIKRNDPVAAKYWMEVKEWAEKRISGERHFDILPKICYEALIKIFNRVSEKDFYTAVRIYRLIKHLRKMLINNGEQVPRLSLDWLRNWGERFSKEPSAYAGEEVAENDISAARSKQTDQVSALRTGA